MGKEPEEIKVVDKRHSANPEETSSHRTIKGEGFEAKESPQADVPPHQLDFSTLAFSFATSALINMGIAPDPLTNKTEKNLDLARQNIDILTILQEKTRGNLTEEEKKLVDSLLTEVRLRFVEVTKR